MSEPVHRPPAHSLVECLIGNAKQYQRALRCSALRRGPAPAVRPSCTASPSAERASRASDRAERTSERRSVRPSIRPVGDQRLRPTTIKALQLIASNTGPTPESLLIAAAVVVSSSLRREHRFTGGATSRDARASHRTSPARIQRRRCRRPSACACAPLVRACASTSSSFETENAFEDLALAKSSYPEIMINYKIY